jgi:hypothetical protein
MRVLSPNTAIYLYSLADSVVQRHNKRLRDTQRPLETPTRLDVLLSRGRLTFTADMDIFPYDHFIPVDVPALPGHPRVIRLFPSHGPVRVVKFSPAGITVEVAGPWSGEWLLFGEPL